MWHESQYKCPVCGSQVWYASHGDEGCIHESESRCRATGCGLYSHEFSYGHVERRVGHFSVSWSWSDDGPSREQTDTATAAEVEAAVMFRHPEFAAMWAAPEYALADWLGEHGFTIQEQAVREQIAAATS